ncbi:MAG TPA: hypothetical protein VIJ29_01420 [Candidatus Paceibacterota bacterium]
MRIFTPFGAIQVSAKMERDVNLGYREGNATLIQQGTAVYAPIGVYGRPNTIQLLAGPVSLPEGVRAFWTPCEEGGRMQPIPHKNVANLPVHVEWKDVPAKPGDRRGEQKKAPHTRTNYQDSLDIILLTPKGEFVSVEVGLITRNGVFYETCQQIWKGWRVRTRGEGSETAYSYVPTHRFSTVTPYSNIWTGMADGLSAAQEDVTEWEAQNNPAEWNPPALSTEVEPDGRQEAIVLYFNLISSTGRLMTYDGVEYFFHFRDIRKWQKGPISTLGPFDVVTFKPGKGRDGHSAAKEVEFVREG